MINQNRLSESDWIASPWNRKVFMVTAWLSWGHIRLSLLRRWQSSRFDNLSVSVRVAVCCCSLVFLLLLAEIETERSSRWLPALSSQQVLKAVRGIILCMGSANERRCYIVRSSLVDWAHAQNDPSIILCMGSGNERRRYSVTSSLIG